MLLLYMDFIVHEVPLFHKLPCFHDTFVFPNFCYAFLSTLALPPLPMRLKVLLSYPFLASFYQQKSSKLNDNIVTKKLEVGMYSVSSACYVPLDLYDNLFDFRSLFCRPLEITFPIAVVSGRFWPVHFSLTL